MNMNAIEERWAHQEQAFRFARNLFARGQNGCMFDMAMGTGKTKAAADVAVAEQIKQLLVVCPLRVVEVWRQQLQRHAPGHFHALALDDRVRSVHEKYCRARDLYAWSVTNRQPVAILVNYDSARLPPFGDWAATSTWDMVIADEIHRIKEPRGRTSMWLAKVGLMAGRRLGLTGTPMPHTPLDVWAQFRFLNPFHFERSYWHFKSRYAVMGGFFNKQIVAWQNLDELEERFRQLAFRVDASVLDLPPEMDETRSADLGKEGARIYREMEREMIAWIGEQKQVTAANALVRLLRLAQITGGALEDESGARHQIDHAKRDLLAELLEDLQEPVVVFCRFRADLEAVHEVVRKLGRRIGEPEGSRNNSAELSGSLDELAVWQAAPPDADPLVLAVQIQAGGVGVDLTRARIAIYYSLGFSLAEYLQSRARIHRPPQSRPVVFYHLLIRNSIDEYIMRAVETRRDLIDSVLQELKEKKTCSANVSGAERT